MSDLYLAPIPKKLSMRPGIFDPRGRQYVKLEADEPQCLIAAAKRTGLDWQITASPAAPKDQVGLAIRLDRVSNIPAEGYRLAINPGGIRITASTAAGAFYGACTLAQIVRSCQLSGIGRQPLDGTTDKGPETSDHRTSDDQPLTIPLPCLSISDWPDFPARGVMLDISRDKVPTMETLYHLVDLLAGWKINQFQLYTEHTFAYLAHPEVWKNASPMTGQQIMALDAYCRERFIELVPNQNCFGHMERWLTLDKYRPMAEAPNGCMTAWGYFENPFSLHPGDRRSLPFIRGLFDELLPHFTSGMFNVGLDETVDLGCGKSKAVCKRRGTGRVYLDFLLKVYDLVRERGKTMQFWGDIIIKHPQLIHELPKDAIALEWGYEFDHPFADHGARFAESGIPFYVCPGTSSWNALSGRTENAIGNITSAAKTGVMEGAIGLLNTDWGDSGHWQPLSVSYLGLLVGAMSAWNARANPDKHLPESLSLHAFGDGSFKMGRAFYDLGNVYKIFRKRTFNSTVMWQMLFRKLNDPKFVEGVDIREFEDMEHRLVEIADAARGDEMTCADRDIVCEEFEHVIGMLRLAGKAGELRLGRKPKGLEETAQEVRKNHEIVWLLRNRPGGLADSEGKIRI